MSETLEERYSFERIHRKAKENFGIEERDPHCIHRKLLSRAQLMRRGNSLPAMEELDPKVSTFSDWVFYLDNEFNWDRYVRPLRISAEVEIRDQVLDRLCRLPDQKIEKQKAMRFEQQKAAITSRASKSIIGAGWVPYYDGTSGSPNQALPIKVLQIDGKPLMAKPDLVFRDRDSGDMLIIEIKTWEPRGKLPPFGWPNLKVQLWCYGMIEWPKTLEWPNAPKNVILGGLVGEAKNDEFTGQLRDLEPWYSNDPRVHGESLDLFKVFGGSYTT